MDAALSILSPPLHEADAERERRNEYNAIITLMGEPIGLRVSNQKWVPFPVTTEDEEKFTLPVGNLLANRVGFLVT